MLELSVPNSNPASRFSRYEIIADDATIPEATEDAVQCTTVLMYTLIGCYGEERGTVSRAISRHRDLEYLKDLLIDINGPIPEDLET